MILGGESGGSADLEIVEASGTTLTAEVGKYYRYDSDVSTLSITLPAITGATEIQELYLEFSVGTSDPSFTVSGGTVKNTNDLSIRKSTIYVFRFMWNATVWIVEKVVSSWAFQEVEYLQSSGTQYMDTGLYVSGNTMIDAYIGTITDKLWGFGAREAWTKNMFQFGNGGTQGTEYHVGMQFYGNNSSYNRIRITNDTAQHHVIAAATSYFDSTEFTREYESFVTPGTLPLFAARDGDNLNYKIMKIYSCKIYEGTVMLRDFIPVRIGQVGYMYDRVTDTLYGNLGTGSFTIGPDV